MTERQKSSSNIKNQLIRLQLTTTGIVLVVTIFFALVFAFFEFKEMHRKEIRTILKNTSLAVETALVFQDSEDASRTLKNFETYPDIIYAEVKDAQGAVFASFGERRSGNGVVDKQEILVDQERLGEVTILWSLDQVLASFYKFLIQMFVWSCCALGLAVGLSLATQRKLSRPMEKLVDFVRAVKDDSSYHHRIHLAEMGASGIGEFHTLATEINFMLDSLAEKDRAIIEQNRDLEKRVFERTQELQKAQAENLRNAHSAGMAEVANSVLHNIGNVINSVNVSSEVIRLAARSKEVKKLSVAVQALKDRGDDLAEFLSNEQQARKLLAFLESYSSHLQEMVDKIIAESSKLGKNMEHVKSVINKQQKYSKGMSLREEIILTDVVTDAIQLGGDSFERKQIDLEVNVQEGVTILSDKHKLLQILVNLISNSRHALMDVDQVREERKLIRIWSEEQPSKNFLKIHVIDNGVGIPKNIQDKIFQYGYTSKPDGHGYGLHYCALASKEIGGQLTLESSDAGKGAHFSLTLPTSEESEHFVEAA